jgi:hypothetical protein
MDGPTSTVEGGKRHRADFGGDTISGDRLGYLSTSATPIKTKYIKTFRIFFFSSKLKVNGLKKHLSVVCKSLVNTTNTALYDVVYKSI